MSIETRQSRAPLALALAVGGLVLSISSYFHIAGDGRGNTSEEADTGKGGSSQVCATAGEWGQIPDSLDVAVTAERLGTSEDNVAKAKYGIANCATPISYGSLIQGEVILVTGIAGDRTLDANPCLAIGSPDAHPNPKINQTFNQVEAVCLTSPR